MFEPFPQVNQNCQPTQMWSVGDQAQVAPAATGFMLGYDAHALSRCPAAPAGSYTSIGSYLRLKAM